MLLRLVLGRRDRRVDVRSVRRTDRHGSTRLLVHRLIVGIVHLLLNILVLDDQASHRLAEVLLVLHGLLKLEAPHQESAADGDDGEADKRREVKELHETLHVDENSGEGPREEDADQVLIAWDRVMLSG